LSPASHDPEGSGPLTGHRIGHTGFMTDSRNPRVLLCVPGFPASLDDSDKPFLLDHARALVAAGIDVTVICPAKPGLPGFQDVEGIEVIRARYAPRRFETLAATGSMYREARGFRMVWVVPMLLSMTLTALRRARSGVDVIYGHWWIPGGIVAVVSAKLARLPSVVHLHGSDAEIARTKFVRMIARWVISKSDRCLAVSKPLGDWGEKISERKIDLLPMPIRSREASDPSRSEEMLILGVGRLVYEKGFDVLVEAVGKLKPEIRPKIVIIGAGPERQLLLDRATAIGVDLYLPGAVSPEKLVKWFSRSSVVVVPSRREGFGLVAAEAAAMGRVVIGTSVGGVPEIIEDGVNGLIVEPDNADALAKALLEVDPSWGSHGPARVRHLSTHEHGVFLRQMCEDLCKRDT